MTPKRCGSVAIFSRLDLRGDEWHELKRTVYRCQDEAEHKGWHHDRATSWDPSYPEPSAKRIREAEAWTPAQAIVTRSLTADAR